jgi:hypothetical protein
LYNLLVAQTVQLALRFADGALAKKFLGGFGDLWSGAATQKGVCG